MGHISCHQRVLHKNEECRTETAMTIENEENTFSKYGKNQIRVVPPPSRTVCARVYYTILEKMRCKRKSEKIKRNETACVMFGDGSGMAYRTLPSNRISVLVAFVAQHIFIVAAVDVVVRCWFLFTTSLRLHIIEH